MTYTSRLQKRQNRFTQRQIYILIGLSVVLIIIIVYFGIAFLFGLTTRISSLQRQNNQADSQNSPGLAPNTPRFSQKFFATSSANLKISGTADPKINVEIFHNDRSLGSNLSSDQGNFSFDVSLEKGANVFVAQAVSDKGKKSDESLPYNINFVIGSPTLDVSSPADGDSIKDSPIVVSGKTDSGNSLTVNDHIIIVQADGSFSYYLNVSDGDNKIKIVSTDPAGNQTVKEMTIKLQK